jgi:hypothetical protein
MRGVLRKLRRFFRQLKIKKISDCVLRSERPTLPPLQHHIFEFFGGNKTIELPLRPRAQRQLRDATKLIATGAVASLDRHSL